MQSIWLPFRQYSVSFRRWVGRPLRSAEANFIEAAERARQLADGSLLMLVNDPTRELMRVILEYVSWHQNVLLPFAISPSLPNIVVDTTRADAFAACRIFSPPNPLPIAGRSICCTRGYDFNSAVLFNANTYCPSVPVYRSRLIGPVHSLVAGAADGSIIIVHGDIAWPWRRNHFRSLWRRTRKNPFWYRYDALRPDPLLLKRRKILRPPKIRYPLKTFNKRSDAPPRRLSPGVALLPLPQIPA